MKLKFTCSVAQGTSYLSTYVRLKPLCSRKTRKLLAMLEMQKTSLFSVLAQFSYSRKPLATLEMQKKVKIKVKFEHEPSGPLGRSLSPVSVARSD